MARRVFVDAWQPDYGSPYVIDSDDNTETTRAAELVEDGEEELRFHRSEVDAARSVALIDGVMRTDARLSTYDTESEIMSFGVAGACASGAVLISEDLRKPTIIDPKVMRVLTWGNSVLEELPEVSGGFRWMPYSIEDATPEGPDRELRALMRTLEAEVAGELYGRGDVSLIVADGPLFRLENVVVGYIKSHHKSYLAHEHHARIPELELGERTSLFRIGGDRYSCYIRVSDMGALYHRWSGVARIEMPSTLPLERARELADLTVATLGRFASEPHRDSRAPQNLQPIGGLERHLRRLLGNGRLVHRAVREAVRLRDGRSSPTEGGA